LHVKDVVLLVSVLQKLTIGASQLHLGRRGVGELVVEVDNTVVNLEHLDLVGVVDVERVSAAGLVDDLVLVDLH